MCKAPPIVPDRLVKLIIIGRLPRCKSRKEVYYRKVIKLFAGIPFMPMISVVRLAHEGGKDVREAV